MSCADPWVEKFLLRSPLAVGVHQSRARSTMSYICIPWILIFTKKIRREEREIMLFTSPAARPDRVCAERARIQNSGCCPFAAVAAPSPPPQA